MAKKKSLRKARGSAGIAVTDGDDDGRDDVIGDETDGNEEGGDFGDDENGLTGLARPAGNGRGEPELSAGKSSAGKSSTGKSLAGKSTGQAASTGKQKPDSPASDAIAIGDIRKAAAFVNSIGGLDKAIALLQILKVAKEVQ